METGVYSVRFTGPKTFGSGVVVVDRGRLHGGDHGYYYIGGYRITEPNRLSAQLHIARHQPGIESVFGPLDQFDLELFGTSTATSFSTQAQIAGHTSISIQVEGRKVSNLDEMA